MKKITSAHVNGDHRVEIELENGTSFTVFVNSDGVVELLVNDPSDIVAELRVNEGYFVSVNLYGHPIGD